MNLPSKTQRKPRLFNVALCLVIVAALAIPAAAAAVVEKITQQSVSASSWLATFDPETGTITYLSIGASDIDRIEQEGSTRRDVSESPCFVYIEQYGMWGYRYGWAEIADANFSGDQSLVSASLKQTVSMFTQGYSDSSLYPIGPVTLEIDVTWTGTGQVYS